MDINTWGVVIGALGGAASVIGVMLPFRKLELYRLTCSFTPPVAIGLSGDSIKGTARGKLSFQYDGKDVGAVTVIQAKIQNSGKQVLKEADIENPITFNFHEFSVLASEVIDHAENVVPIADGIEGACSRWKFKSLNPNEYFIIEFLINGTRQEIPDVSCRILNLRGIEIEAPSWNVQGRGSA